ncbi:hypothetical protein A3842_19410 [Paenibacillus sp. P3E]|uniref:hypothetical protein n=1 Tax=Paenibacillus sp. P3E TaxID=1349435 RepID=UPI00093B797E|nr:hypothetical protein [Paenibacillus sp. P3E]OKP75623.1 hypothetical protein A3842_19410 [Paenibacillus sp. P3E]
MQKNVDAGMIVFWSVAVLLLLLVILRQYLRLREHFPARLYPYQADGHYGPGAFFSQADLQNALIGPAASPGLMSAA